MHRAAPLVVHACTCACVKSRRALWYPREKERESPQGVGKGCERRGMDGEYGKDRGQPAAKRSLVERGRFYRRNQGQRAKGKATFSCHYAMLCHFDKFMTAGVPVSSSLPVSVPEPLCPSPPRSPHLPFLSFPHIPSVISSWTISSQWSTTVLSWSRSCIGQLRVSQLTRVGWILLE